MSQRPQDRRDTTSSETKSHLVLIPGQSRLPLETFEHFLPSICSLSQALGTSNRKSSMLAVPLPAQCLGLIEGPEKSK